MFELFFSRDGAHNIFSCFVIYKGVEIIFFCETGNNALFVLFYPKSEIIGDADIKSSFGFVRHDINKIYFWHHIMMRLGD